MAEIKTRLQAARETAGQTPPGFLGGPPVVSWEPFPHREGKRSPQLLAVESEADELFFGGAAGCGKSDALLGLAFTRHRNSIIFRREYPQIKGLVQRARAIVRGRGKFNGGSLTWVLDDGRLLEFGAVQHEESKEKYQGRPHDGVFFDELPHFTRSQYRFLIGWNRNDADVDQRCRVVCTGNPPTTPEGRWVVEEWAPWLDSEFPDPEEPGKLRWYAILDGKLTWLKDGQEYRWEGKDGKVQVIPFKAGEPFTFVNERCETEEIQARSRTFIPGRVDDNPVLLKQGYKSTLQGMPEPLRSQMLYGDFNAGMQDDEWQLIPSAWVRAANERWLKTPKPEGPPTVMGVDPARGGVCKTVIGKRWGSWFGRLEKHPGKGTPDGPAVLGLMLESLAKEANGAFEASVYIDLGAIGSSPYDLAVGAGLKASPFNGGKGTRKRDRRNVMKFANLRAWSHWNLREMLDPQLGDEVCIPPDQELLADLCAARWFMRGDVIQIESKDDIIKRVGRSPDCSDCLTYTAMPPKGAWAAESF
jgi:hypothetical protein